MTSGKPTGTDIPADIEAAAERVRALADQVVDQAKQNGLAWLEGYERVLQNMLDLEEQAAKGTGQDWVTQLASAHANFVRETSSAILDAMRQQLTR